VPDVVLDHVDMYENIRDHEFGMNLDHDLTKKPQNMKENMYDLEL